MFALLKPGAGYSTTAVAVSRINIDAAGAFRVYTFGGEVIRQDSIVALCSDDEATSTFSAWLDAVNSTKVLSQDEDISGKMEDADDEHELRFG